MESACRVWLPLYSLEQIKQVCDCIVRNVMQVSHYGRFVAQAFGQLQSEVFFDRGWRELTGLANLIEDAAHRDSCNMPCWPFGMCSSTARTSSRRLVKVC